MSIKQNDSVFQAVCSVLGQDGFENAVELTKDQRGLVIGIVTQGIMSGEVDFSSEAKLKYDTEAKVKSYTNGMVSNHLRKDKRLNGDIKYIIKNPGSRAGQGDDQLKALKALRSTLTDITQQTSVDTAIANRSKEIAATKVKTVTVDMSFLPEEFKHLVK